MIISHRYSSERNSISSQPLFSASLGRTLWLFMIFRPGISTPWPVLLNYFFRPFGQGACPVLPDGVRLYRIQRSGWSVWVVRLCFFSNS